MKKLITAISLTAVAVLCMAQTITVPLTITIHGGLQTDFTLTQTNNTGQVLATTNQVIYDLAGVTTLNFWFFAQGNNASASGVQTAYYSLSPDMTNWTPVAASNSITVTMSGTAQVLSISSKQINWGRFFRWNYETNADATYNNTNNLIYLVPR